MTLSLADRRFIFLPGNFEIVQIGEKKPKKNEDKHFVKFLVKDEENSDNE